MPERLDVVYSGAVIGHLERIEGALRFAYTREVIDAREGQILISASLKVRSKPYAEGELLPYFEGLLPEGPARERVAARFRLDFSDVFGLLREIGRDSAGAISLVPEGTDLKAVAAEGVEWLNPDQLADLVANMATAPLGIDPERDIRLSLAGVQDKVIVVVGDDNRIGRPRGTTPSTHILKPGPRAQFPDLVPNEAFCLALARLSGLNVVQADIIVVGAEPALLVERYDRRRYEDKVIRVHQEDFCQALRVPGYRKYQSEGGPDNRRMVNLLRDVSSDAASDIDELLDRLAFNYLVGNSDAHAKNHALIYADQYRLAPAYDLVSSALYEGVDKDLATSIGGEYRAHQIAPEHWLRELVRLNLNEDRSSRRLANLADRVKTAYPKAKDWLDARNVPLSKIETIFELVSSRSAVLRSIRQT
jgi:serine/threonine-protein kinase HipA